MNLVGASILLIVLLVVLSAPRRWALLAVMAGVLYLTQGQQVQVFGFNMYAIRFVELAGFVRVFARREFSASKLNLIDRTLILLYLWTTVVFLLRTKVDQVYQTGIMVDAFLCYFTFRGLVGGADDFRWFLGAFVLLLLPYTALVLLESFTQHNPFDSMGGVVLNGEHWMRGGRVRCQSSFRHASLLGTLGASFLPLYIGLWCARSDRFRASLGILLCALIIWASNSGGPVNTAAIGIVCWLFWKLRTKLRLVRWYIAFGVLVLGLIMKAPIWYLPAKISALSGGDGWHRSYLMDMAFQSLDKWWLIGMPFYDTRDWFPYVIEVTGSADITNVYLSFGLTGGLAAMILFFVLLIRTFALIGSALTASRLPSCNSPGSELLLWGLGAMLLGHMFNWLGITYFDQINVVWFMQLAAISTVADSVLESAAVNDTPGDTWNPPQTPDTDYRSPASVS